MRVPLEKAVYRLLIVYGLPQSGGDPDKCNIDYIFEFEGYVFDIYDYYSEHLSLGYLSPIETPTEQFLKMRERGETPPEEPPPEVADRLQALIEDLLNYPIAANSGTVL